MFSLADSRESPTQTAEGLAANHLSFSLCERANQHMCSSLSMICPQLPRTLTQSLSQALILCWVSYLCSVSSAE